MRNWIFRALGLCLLISPHMFAQATSVEQQLQHCLTIGQDPARLACYDALSRALTTSPSNISANKPSPSAQPSVATAVAASPASSDVATAALQAAAADPANFGKTVTVAELGPDSQHSLIKAITRKKKTTIELDNGQRWLMTDEVEFLPVVGDRCIIKKGMMGAFYLQKDGSNKTYRVKRLD